MPRRSFIGDDDLFLDNTTDPLGPTDDDIPTDPSVLPDEEDDPFSPIIGDEPDIPGEGEMFEKLLPVLGLIVLYKMVFK